MSYEVLWYEREKPIFKEFRTRKQAMAFYEKIKNDKDKTGFWVTKRNKDWEVIEDIIF